MTSETDRREVMAHVILVRLELIKKLLAAQPGQEPQKLKYTEADVDGQVAKAKDLVKSGKGAGV